MRDHLKECFERKLTPFPGRNLQTTRTISEEPLLTGYRISRPYGMVWPLVHGAVAWPCDMT